MTLECAGACEDMLEDFGWMDNQLSLQGQDPGYPSRVLHCGNCKMLINRQKRANDVSPALEAYHWFHCSDRQWGGDRFKKGDGKQNLRVFILVFNRQE